ncbi:hypothetical protein T03_2172, partial [Trichinella britovi]
MFEFFDGFENDFAHNLQFYETLPTVNMDYRPAVNLAIQRHQGF